MIEPFGIAGIDHGHQRGANAGRRKLRVFERDARTHDTRLCVLAVDARQRGVGRDRAQDLDRAFGCTQQTVDRTDQTGHDVIERDAPAGGDDAVARHEHVLRRRAHLPGVQ